MPDEMTIFKTRFNRALEPIKVMLVSKKGKLHEKDWAGFVERTKESILRCPDQYLGEELPQPAILKIIIDEIFDEFFIREQHSRIESE